MLHICYRFRAIQYMAATDYESNQFFEESVLLTSNVWRMRLSLAIFRYTKGIWFCSSVNSHFLDIRKAFDSVRLSLVIFLDIGKAFDSVHSLSLFRQTKGIWFFLSDISHFFRYMKDIRFSSPVNKHFYKHTKGIWYRSPAVAILYSIRFDWCGSSPGM